MPPQYFSWASFPLYFTVKIYERKKAYIYTCIQTKSLKFKSRLHMTCSRLTSVWNMHSKNKIQPLVLESVSNGIILYIHTFQDVFISMTLRRHSSIHWTETELIFKIYRSAWAGRRKMSHTLRNMGNGSRKSLPGAISKIKWQSTGLNSGFLVPKSVFCPPNASIHKPTKKAGNCGRPGSQQTPEIFRKERAGSQGHRSSRQSQLESANRSEFGPGTS